MSNVSIFCDFDGTITTKDNIIAIMKQFAPPGWEKIKDEILAERVSIREGVGQLFSLIPVNKKEDIIHFVRNEATIREGFSSFLSFVEDQKFEFNVVSGGIDFFVYPLLAPYALTQRVYCNGSDFSGETIAITWPYRCDSLCSNDCGCCKPSILRSSTSNDDFKIVIGDSITDLHIAKEADLVFACDDFLIEKCRQHRLNYKAFTSFYEIIDHLQQQKEGSDWSCV